MISDALISHIADNYYEKWAYLDDLTPREP